MANRNEYLAAELSKIFTHVLKSMAASKTKVTTSNISSKMLKSDDFINLITHAMAGGEKSELLRYVTPLKGFVPEEKLKEIEDMVFDPEVGYSDTLKALLSGLSDHIISLERRQHRVSTFIEDVFTKFVTLQAELTTSFQGSIDFVEQDLELDRKLLGDAEDMHNVLKSDESIDYLRNKMLESFSNFVETFGSKTENKQGQLDTINKDYTTVNSELEDYKKQVNKLQNDINKYKTESVTDHLTGLYNRKYMDMKIGEEIERYKRMNTPFCVVLVDIDHFKQVNDTYGHLIGDQVLKHLSNLIKENIRKTDFAFRYGGEEFLILLSNVDVRNASHVSDQIRKKLETTNFSIKDKSFNCTASFGISIIEKDDTAESVIKRADDRLYKAKEMGRNMIIAS